MTPSHVHHPSAPGAVRFCSRCGQPMTTRTVGGRPRRVCSTCGFVHFVDPKVGVGVAVLDADRLLLVRRAMEPERGRWGLPAGYLDAGESPRETAARETLEETGLVVDVGDLVDVYADPGGPGASLFVLYRARLVGGALAAADDVDDARFFAATELPAADLLAFPSTHDAVRRWHAGLL